MAQSFIQNNQGNLVAQTLDNNLLEDATLTDLDCEAREKEAAEAMLREIEASLGQHKKKKGNFASKDRSYLMKRGRPKGVRNAKRRSSSSEKTKPLFNNQKKVKQGTSPKKKKKFDDVNTVVLQQAPVNAQGHTVLAGQIQIQPGQAQQIITMPKIMSPQPIEQNINLNQTTNLMTFVHQNQQRAVDDGMRNIAGTQYTQPRIIATQAINTKNFMMKGHNEPICYATNPVGANTPLLMS